MLNSPFFVSRARSLGKKNTSEELPQRYRLIIRQPGYLALRLKTRGFASPPHDGFAFIIIMLWAITWRSIHHAITVSG
jgi:hypothetical protein